MRKLWRWYGPQAVGACASAFVLFVFGRSGALAALAVFVVITWSVWVLTRRAER